MDARRTLLSALVDYAGLYPPASLDMESAVREYQRWRQSDWAWMLGPFVVGAGRLGEWGRALAATPGEARATGGPWLLSVLLGPDPARDLRDAVEFAAARPQECRIVAFENRPASPAVAAELSRTVGGSAPVFHEIDPEAALDEWLAALAAAGGWAKLRTGSTEPGGIPSVGRVARFLRACADATVGLKFTAGLHHARRGVHPLRYEDDAPRAPMHGFLQVFTAAALARRGAPTEQIEAALADEAPEAFGLDQEALRWREQHFEIEELAGLRREFARSFGSCSFEEPLTDLREMAIL